MEDPAAESDDEADDPSSQQATEQQPRSRRPMRKEQSTAALRAARQQDHRPSLFDTFCATMRGLLGGSENRYFLSRYQVAASTPLQMTVYFSAPLGLVWAILNQVLFYWKSRTFDVPLVVAVLSPMAFWVWFLLEPIRLVLGYVGNLSERVAWLGGFWVLTVAPQLIVQIYFLVAQPILWFNLPIDYVSSGIMAGLNLLQLILSFSTIRRLVAKAMADFHLQPVDANDAAVNDSL